MATDTLAALAAARVIRGNQRRRQRYSHRSSRSTHFTISISFPYELTTSYFTCSEVIFEKNRRAQAILASSMPRRSREERLPFVSASRLGHEVLGVELVLVERWSSDALENRGDGTASQLRLRCQSADKVVLNRGTVRRCR
jgi:hypothetical protein